MRRIIHWLTRMTAFGTIAFAVYACVTGSTSFMPLKASLTRRFLEEDDQRAFSAHNLTVIAECLRTYHNQFGHLPPDISELKQFKIPPGVLRSPLGGEYVLTGVPMGQGRDVVCREVHVPGGGGHLLYADGRVEWVGNQ